MEAFLLNIIVVLFLVLALLTFILKLVFRIGHPYARMPTSVPVASDRPGGSSPIGGLLILILLGYLAYIYFIHNSGGDKSININDLIDEGPSIRVHEPPFNTHSDLYHPTILTERPIDFPTSSSSTFEDEGSYYTIQINAFIDEAHALSRLLEMEDTFDGLHIIQVVGDAIPFKLTIGEFSQKSMALDHKRQKNIEGFVRYVDY